MRENIGEVYDQFKDLIKINVDQTNGNPWIVKYQKLAKKWIEGQGNLKS